MNQSGVFCFILKRKKGFYMASLKVHFIPKRKFNRRAHKGVCGQQFVELTYKTELVTCERCKQSESYKGEKNDNS